MSAPYWRQPPDIRPKSQRTTPPNLAQESPSILDNGIKRSLYFDFTGVQSVMHCADPDRLCLAYTRKMMAFLLFNRATKRSRLSTLQHSRYRICLSRKCPKVLSMCPE